MSMREVINLVRSLSGSHDDEVIHGVAWSHRGDIATEWYVKTRCGRYRGAAVGG
jgi:hypothetical protein